VCDVGHLWRTSHRQRGDGDMHLFQRKMIARIMGVVAFGSVFVGARPSGAEIIKCSFTEPFITTTYSSNTNTLTITDDTTRQISILTNISFQIIKPNVFEIWNSKQEVIQRFELNLHGTDGMSETVYPYDANFVLKGLRGGCTSNHLH